MRSAAINRLSRRAAALSSSGRPPASVSEQPRKKARAFVIEPFFVARSGVDVAEIIEQAERLVVLEDERAFRNRDLGARRYDRLHCPLL